MCAEKIQRFLMAIILTVTMVLSVSGQMQWAVVLQTFVILMVLVWAFTDFCPSLWFFGKLFGKCPRKD
jgi:Na+-transporting methylmalonyl-CoA/oxaloacetate decarboxylase beta subunit